MHLIEAETKVVDDLVKVLDFETDRGHGQRIQVGRPFLRVIIVGIVVDALVVRWGPAAFTGDRSRGLGLDVDNGRLLGLIGGMLQAVIRIGGDFNPVGNAVLVSWAAQSAFVLAETKQAVRRTVNGRDRPGQG